MHQAEWVLARKERTPDRFRYFKDQYALMLLEWRMGGARSIRDLKQSELAPLLSKPILAPALSRASDGVLRLEHLASVRATSVHEYRVTLGTWGDFDCWSPSYDQTTRPGMNVVLQLNFTREHNRAYQRLLRPGLGTFPFLWSCHPNAPRLPTMSWARIDVAFDDSEAIVEEIQSDWIKNAQSLLSELDRAEGSSEKEQYLLDEFGADVAVTDVHAYVKSVLQPHTAVWAEATLAAALDLVRRLGIRRVFYNTLETGCFLKELGEDGRPPRALYTTLPTRFCFRRTHERPRALSRSRDPRLREKLAKKWLEWFVLEL
jgi:hypothetical protein